MSDYVRISGKARAWEGERKERENEGNIFFEERVLLQQFQPTRRRTPPSAPLARRNGPTRVTDHSGRLVRVEPGPADPSGATTRGLLVPPTGQGREQRDVAGVLEHLPIGQHGQCRHRRRRSREQRTNVRTPSRL